MAEPTWHPFQLAFLLLNLQGIIHPDTPIASTVDLLFFPTGGGKTEAYLGLAAFTLLHRRFREGVGGVDSPVRRRDGPDALHAPAPDARPALPRHGPDAAPWS